MSDLLSNLGEILDQQFYTGENQNKGLQLGDFANKYDKSAQRQYVEQGYFRNHAADNVAKQLDILTQKPEATILVKKRAFGSLAENFRPDVMDREEVLFMKATKMLFRDKCRQIEAYERLTKISQVSYAIARVDDSLLPIVFGAVDALSAFGVGLGKFGDTVDRVRKILAFNEEKSYSTWQAAPNDNFKNSFGEGTGVIEFTNVRGFSTTTTTDFAGGSFSLDFSDPYNIMKVRFNDIEKVLGELSSLDSSKGFNLLTTVASDTLELQKTHLNLVRTTRGAYPIRFIVEPDTFVGKRVRAIIENIGFEINFDGSILTGLTDSTKFDPSSDFGAEGVREQGITDEEKNLISNIAGAIYSSLSLAKNSRRRASTAKGNGEINRIRNKLRLHYMNKSIVQPMDTVSIFVRSQKQQDMQVAGGLQSALTGLKYTQGINRLIDGIQDNLNSLTGSSIEKAIFVGADFPNPLWYAIRNQFVSDKNGCCVFTGVVEGVSSSYSASSGAWSTRVNGKDNAAFFKYGIINRSPSIDVYNGTLFDPLTPFKQSYDSATGKEISLQEGGVPELLDQNKSLFKSAFIRTPNGPLAGTVPTEAGYFNSVNKSAVGSSQTKQGPSERQPFYDPAGMVYRWKEGIASLVLAGDSYLPNSQKRGQSVTVDPFAGQDIMNVISLMVTGEPYNYANFYKATTKFNVMTRDPLTGEDGASSYFRGLRSEIRNNNAIYGNFLPFKRLTMDEASFETILTSQIRITAKDTELQRLLLERSTLADKFEAVKTLAAVPNGIMEDLQTFDAKIQLKIKEIYDETSQKDNPPFNFLGDDVSFQPNDDLSVDGIPLKKDGRQELRKKIKFLTRRLAWKVRANEDRNLFIVDDSYDKDYDLQAFEKELVNGFSIYKSEYTTAATQIADAAAKLQLEIFCNTQGHIEIRNPKYNNIPSSVFNRMLRQKEETGVQVFPQFLQDLFVHQIRDLYDNIEAIEDQIRLYAYVLNYTSDDQCVGFIRQLSGTTIGNAKSFSFLSGEYTGKVVQTNDVISALANPEIDSQNGISGFSVIDRAKFIQSRSGKFTSLKQIQSQASESPRYALISSRLAKRTGQVFNIAQEFGSYGNGVVKTDSSDVAVLQVSNKIASLLSQRQSAVKTAANASKNLKESAALSESSTLSLSLPSVSGGSKTPKILEHMIEDESYDDLGPGSRERYIIKRRDITSYTSTENKPSHTSITVVGNFGDHFIGSGQLPSDFNAFPNSHGNALATAMAVDYDYMRMYGSMIPQSVDAPTLSNPDSQLAPYAVSILNRARKEVLSADLTVVGNEFQQPGEVVYMEEEDLLYYVDSVSHSFTYGGGFTTSMKLTYGHNPGEYIPTPLDVIGKVLYKNNQHLTRLDSRRQGDAFNQENVGAVAVGITSTNTEDIFSNAFGDKNRAVLDRVISAAGPALSQKSKTFVPVLEVRFYNNGKVSSVSGVNGRLGSIAASVQQYLLGGKEFDGAGSIPSLGLKKAESRLSSFSASNQVVVKQVNMNEPGEFRFVSRNAFYVAREIVEKVEGRKAPQQEDIDRVIHDYVLDFWITYENLGSKK